MATLNTNEWRVPSDGGLLARTFSIQSAGGEGPGLEEHDRMRRLVKNRTDAIESTAFFSGPLNPTQTLVNVSGSVEYDLLPTKEHQIWAQFYQSNTQKKVAKNAIENSKPCAKLLDASSIFSKLQTRKSDENDCNISEIEANTEIVLDLTKDRPGTSGYEYKYNGLTTTYYNDPYDLEEQRQIVRNLRENDKNHDISILQALERLKTTSQFTDSYESIKTTDSIYVTCSSRETSETVIIMPDACKFDPTNQSVIIHENQKEVNADAKQREGNSRSTTSPTQTHLTQPCVNFSTDKNKTVDKTLKIINQLDETPLKSEDCYQTYPLKLFPDLDEKYSNYEKSVDNDQELEPLENQNNALGINPRDKKDDPISVKNKSYSIRADNVDSFKMVISPILKCSTSEDTDKKKAFVVFHKDIYDLNISSHNLKEDLQIRVSDEAFEVSAACNDNNCPKCQKHNKVLTITVKNDSITIHNCTRSCETNDSSKND